MKSNRIGKLPLFPQVRSAEAAYSKISLPFFPTSLAQFIFHFQLSLYSVIFLKNGHFSSLVSEKILVLKKKKKKDVFWLQDASYKGRKISVSIESLVED